MIKVAIATSKEGLLDHFGHCEQFMIYEINDGKISDETTIKNPEHQRGFLPKYLYDLGVTHIIAQNMGAMAVKIIEGLKMGVFYGIEGYHRDVISQFLDGSLVSSSESCKHHDDHEHGEHHHEHHHHD